MATTATHLDRLGFGRYQYLLVGAVGLAAMAESVEMGAGAPLTAALGRAYGLSQAQRAELAAVGYVGEGVGTLVAGVLCDVFGRRGMLLWASASSALALLAFAALPASSSFAALVCLRGVGGVGIGMMVVSTTVLAVESCCAASRCTVMFSIQFITLFGYLLSAIGLSHYMPGFGEDPSDAWRAFCLFMSVPFVLGFLSVTLLVESPLFLAVRGDGVGCAAALEYIAKLSGCPAPVLVSQLPDRKTHTKRRSFLAEVSHEVKRMCVAIATFPGLLTLLVLIDSCRTFFTAGISYVSKDIFLTVSSQAMPGTTLNAMANLAPFLGILSASAFLRFGIRFIMLVGSALGAACAWTLTMPHVKGHPMAVLAMVLGAKFTFSPLLACVQLMKAEAFPTEVRGSMLAMMHFLAMFAGMLALASEELLRGRGRTAWQGGGLDAYLCTLAVAVLACGLLTAKVPSIARESRLADFVMAPEGEEPEGARSDAEGVEEHEALSIWAQAIERKSAMYGAAEKRG